MTAALVLLGIIAASSLVQIVFVAFAARKGLGLARQLGEAKKRFRDDLGPTLEDASRIARNAEAVSEVISRQARRMDAAVSSATERIEDFRQTVVPELERLAMVATAARAVGKGIAAYRRRRHRRRR